MVYISFFSGRYNSSFDAVIEIGVVGSLSYDIYSKEAKRRVKTMVNSENSRAILEKCIFPIISLTKAHTSATSSGPTYRNF